MLSSQSSSGGLVSGDRHEFHAVWRGKLARSSSGVGTGEAVADGLLPPPFFYAVSGDPGTQRTVLSTQSSSGVPGREFQFPWMIASSSPLGSILTPNSQQSPSSVATARRVHTCGRSVDCVFPHVSLDSALSIISRTLPGRSRGIAGLSVDRWVSGQSTRRE